MATRSFFLATLVATLVGIGFAEMVQPNGRQDFHDPRATLIGMCLTNGIACGAQSSRVAFRAF